MIAEGFEEFVDNMLKKQEQQIKERQDCNRELVKIISEMVEKHHELRFGQILYILGVYCNNIDLFNEESRVMLDRVEVKFKKFE